MKIDDNIVIKCKNLGEVENSLNKLKELGFKTKEMYEDKRYLIIANTIPSKAYFCNYETPSIDIDCNVVSYDYFFKLYKKQKPQQQDLVVDKDGRIIKVNDYNSDKTIFIFPGDLNKGMMLCAYSQDYIDKFINCGLAFATEEARDRAEFKLEIETKLKNIAERLNKEQKIDWEDKDQNKYEIYYDYMRKKIECRAFCYCKDQGIIYCLNENFLNVAKQEIGEENLIKYFKEQYE